jgi:rapamycin-insensitive companion of mTOR
MAGRMKSRPEYRTIFTSPKMFYRALHIISTQRYRLPVRRYIVDLFNLELNPELASTLLENAESLRAHPSYKISNSDARRLSMFPLMGRPRRTSESDDEDDELDAPIVPGASDEQPAISLRPVSKTIGFAI